ncbi:MAG: hydantoinase/carbamoylase family amidase, partial [Actinobacteria bacterium]|nr:hydantoinase/carbamoylase family amidase [Actinomycetota bacterium]
MTSSPAIDPGRVLADLDELARRTGGPGGARRLAWTDTWRAARRLLVERLGEIGLAGDEDEAGNLWATLPGVSAERLVLGSHLDSVPAGGPLDGALGVLAALEVLRALVEADGFPALTVALVDWADEEGARFGHSLFGSSAATGALDLAAVRELVDAEGDALPRVLADHGVEVERIATDLESGLDGAFAYLELHIEQGPVLEAEGLPVAAVSGTVGVERFLLRFRGAAAHAGSTPMSMRADALLAAAATALEVETIACRHDGRGTTGTLALAPGALTVVAGSAELGVDLRHEDAAELARMRAEVLRAAEEFAAGRGCLVEEAPVWRAAPTAFDPDLVERARAAAEAAG